VNINAYFSRKYDDMSYNCLHFARDVWLDLTGEDLTAKLQGLLGEGRKLTKSHFRAFRKLNQPLSPCLVLMTQLGKDPHIGVYFNGNVFHIRKSGVEFLPANLACRWATSIRYYR